MPPATTRRSRRPGASTTRRSTGRPPARRRHARRRRSRAGGTSARRRARRGGARRSQAIFAATWPGSRLQPLSSRSRAGSIRSAAAVTLRSRTAVHPDQRGAQRLARGVGGDQPVQLRSERHRADCVPVDGSAHLGQRLRHGPEPLAGVLLGPPGLGIRERVGHVGRRDLLAVRSDRLRAGALRADVDADHELRGHSAASESSPGPRR